MADFALNLGRLVSTFGVKNTIGEPQRLAADEVTPVAVSITGFGGGSAGELNEGGGGGGVSVPLGAYVQRHGAVRFEPNTVALVAVAIPLVWVTGRALRGVVRAAKK